VYRYIEPDSPKQAPLRMLFQPAGAGVFFKACEADSWRALVAAILDDPEYETADLETRLVHRLRLADDVVLLTQLEERNLQVADHDGPTPSTCTPTSPSSAPWTGSASSRCPRPMTHRLAALFTYGTLRPVCPTSL
jgi:hypothetical protein